MSLVIDMKTRAVLHTSGDDKGGAANEQSAIGKMPIGCDLRLVAFEPDPMDAWRKWAPGLLPDHEDSDPDAVE